MLYYSNEARESHISEITRLIDVVSSIPCDNVGGTINATNLVKYLSEYRKLIEREIDEENSNG